MHSKEKEIIESFYFEQSRLRNSLLLSRLLSIAFIVALVGLTVFLIFQKVIL